VPSPRGRAYPRFLFREVMPLVERSFRVDPDRISLGGSSYGAIAALYSTTHAPRRIAGLLLESPPLFMFGERLTRDAVTATWPPVVYVGVGTKETDDAEVSARGRAAIERFAAAARVGGARVVVNRVEGGTHSSAAWRARFPSAIAVLFRKGPGACPAQAE
jgi:predicted alpha/beta superfamily hydrolase